MASFNMWFAPMLALMLCGGVASSVADERPIAKVLGLLRGMQATLETEASQEQEMYDAMICWCETNDKEKTKAIKDGQAKDKMLTELIPQLAAKSTKLEVEMEGITKELGENKEALATATELRAKEQGEFREMESSTVDSISGLKNAVAALSKPHALNQEVLLQVSTAVSRVQSLGKSNSGFMQRSKPANLQRAVAAFLQEHKGASPHEEYAPQSGEIFGIMKGMKESFEGNLANGQQEEKDAVRSFGKLKAAKSDEIADAEEMLQSKTASKAETDEKNEMSKEDLDDTRKTVSSDTSFLMDLKERCRSFDHQFEQRVKMRQDETKAVAQAIEILDGDEAHATFSRSLGLVQAKSISSLKSAARASVSRLLRSAARRLHSPKLSILATAVQDDVFSKIKDMVDKLVANLEETQAEEVAQRNKCIEDFNTNEKETYAKNSAKDDLVTKIEDLTLVIKKLDEEIADAQQEISDTHIQMKQAGNNRIKENKEFQSTIADQRASQVLIQKAVDKLKSFYDAKLLQLHKQVPEGPPANFGAYEKQGASTGVIGMMEMIISDSKKTEEEAIKDEQESQSGYEQFMADSNASIASLTQSISDKTEKRAAADGDKIKTEDDLARTNEDLAELAKINADLHSECDYLMKNFEERQSSRTAEMESLREAKAMMSGASL